LISKIDDSARAKTRQQMPAARLEVAPLRRLEYRTQALPFWNIIQTFTLARKMNSKMNRDFTLDILFGSVRRRNCNLDDLLAIGLRAQIAAADRLHFRSVTSQPVGTTRQSGNSHR